MAALSTVAALKLLPAAQIKQALLAGRARIRENYLRLPNAARMLRSHSCLVDGVLESLWREAGIARCACLLAVGGYGRGQLFPYSDVDILVLLPGEADVELKAKLEGLIGLLWDVGLEVGHSVRTVAECVDQAKRDVTVQTNLLEARFLAGSRALHASFQEAMARAFDPSAFFRAKQLEQEQRHVKFLDVAYNLEPNLKDSPGGLRDLHTLLWISRALGLPPSWRELARRGVLDPEEARQIARHEAFLQNLRIRLHYLAGRREDRLLFDFQEALARQHGITDSRTRRGAELLMQRYYRTAKAVSQLNAILMLNLEARIFPPLPQAPQALNERFQVKNGLLAARCDDLFERYPSAILESFLLLQQHPEIKGREAKLLRALWRATRRMGPAFRRDPTNRALFLEILRQPRGVTHELRRMNRYGVLGRYIPAFGRIVGQMQHDLYHVYTVDEHILMVVRNLRRFALTEFAHEYPLCSRLMSDFERPEVLYLAALFHDVAKGRGGDHSRLGAAEARRFCRQHTLAPEDMELVVWLVENHLMMSATAQKQDLSNPDVIARFAARVGSERRLVALYLLTVADIRGTSPKVWNSWKAKLLEDLFLAARQHLSGSTQSAASALEARKDEALRLLRLYAIPERAHEKLWSQLDMVYFLRHEPQEIAWHTRLLNYRVNAAAPVVKARLASSGEGVQVVIYCPDQKYLFARICDCFARLSFNIVEAKIHTTRHGYALDSFLVLDPENKPQHYRDLMGIIEYEIAHSLATGGALPAPPTGRISRHLKHFPLTPEIIFQPDDKGRFILQLVAGDRPGLLSRVARVLADSGVNVHSAKITTLGERAEDTFLVSGACLEDDRALLRLETDLVEALKT